MRFGGHSATILILHHCPMSNSGFAVRQRGPHRFRNEEISDYEAERETFWTSNPVDLFH